MGLPKNGVPPTAGGLFSGKPHQNGKSLSVDYYIILIVYYRKIQSGDPFSHQPVFHGLTEAF
jgi:hypothetical protein